MITVKQHKNKQNDLSNVKRVRIRQEIVEVFKTNVHHEADARLIKRRLEGKFPGSAINFDLEDCDKVLRIAFDTPSNDVNKIMDEVSSYGFSIEPLP